ncbi:MAG: phosphotransferase [Myxococcales bacterium]
MSIPTPLTAEELTAEWLQQALQSSDGLRGGRVVSLDAEPLERGGYASDLVRLRPRYEGASGPETLIAKLPPAAESVRSVVAAFGFFPREVRFFRELSPRVPVTTPRCYFAQLDDSGALGALLLEDLSALRAEGASDAASPDETEAAVDAAARLHGAFWDDPELRASGWLAGDTARRYQGAALLFRERSASFVELAGQTAPKDFVRRLSAVADFIARQGERSARPGCTLMHGDYRLDNLLFPRGGGAPVVLDWQLTGFAPGAYDLAYFMAQSLTPGARRARGADLLGRYLRALQAAGVRGYDRDALLLDYRRSLLTCSLIIVNLSGTVLETRQRAAGGGDDAGAAADVLPGLTALFESMTERTLSAIMDEDALDCLQDA